MTLVHKRAAGVFPDCQATESALNQLKSSGFPMDKVSVVVRHVSQDDQSMRSQDEFARQKNLEWLEHGAIAGGTLGSISGLLMGLSNLAISGVGPQISPEQIELYTHRLTQGHYLVVVEGTDDEIGQAETILKAQDVQNWGVFSTLIDNVPPLRQASITCRSTVGRSVSNPTFCFTSS